MAHSVTAIIVNYNGGDMNITCIDSLMAEGISEVIVVDNGSHDGSPEMLAARYGERIRILRNAANLGFGKACNQGACVSNGSLLLFFNNDAWCDEGMISALTEFIEKHDDVGIVGPLVLASDDPGCIQSAMLTIDRWGFAFDPRNGRPVGSAQAEAINDGFFISGCALMVRADLFATLDGFDDGMFMFCEDIDLCWRAQSRGWRIICVPDARCYHIGGGTARMGEEAGAYTTSSFRISHRERNALRMMCVNLSLANLLIYLTLYTPILIAEALCALLLFKADIAGAYAEAFKCVAADVRALYRRRQVVQRDRSVADNVLMRNWSRRNEKLRAIRKLGIPKLRPVDHAKEVSNGAP